MFLHFFLRFYQFFLDALWIELAQIILTFFNQFENAQSVERIYATDITELSYIVVQVDPFGFRDVDLHLPREAKIVSLIDTIHTVVFY